MEKELHIQKIKSRLMVADNSASKASLYYTPPEDDLFHCSQLNLQTTPIHINYIDENLDHQKLELYDFKIDPQMLLFSKSELYVNPEGASSSQAAAMAALLGCSIEDNNQNAQLLEEHVSHVEMTKLKDASDVKNSKSCPAIYKVSKQQDGSTLHELLTEDGAPHQMVHLNPVDESTLTTLQMPKEKLNIVVDDSDEDEDRLSQDRMKTELEDSNTPPAPALAACDSNSFPDKCSQSYQQASAQPACNT